MAQQNRDKIRRHEENPGDLRLPPYLKLDGPISYSTAGGALNLVDLGTPSKGYRWLVHQLGMVSQTVIDDPDFTGVRAHFYIGAFRRGVLPSPTDWAYDLLSLTQTDFTLNKTWGSPALKVLENQHLFVYLTNGGLNGYGYIPFARVEQVPDGAVKLVQNA